MSASTAISRRPSKLSEPQPKPAGAARQRLLGGLPVSCAAAGDAHQAGGHRPPSNSSSSSAAIRSASCAIPTTFKKDRPYLDEITVRTIDSRATRMLAFSTGDYDITFPSDVSIPLMKDVKARAPNAICEVITTGTLINLMVNRVNSAVRQSRHPPRDVAGAGPQAIQQYPDGRNCAAGRGDAAEAGGASGACRRRCRLP